ncbi:MAG: hypothetical protein KTR13_05950 [Saprospiraceae bacterium]|nr:hypothetical protein [Saprospiraceae bacterium]
MKSIFVLPLFFLLLFVVGSCSDDDFIELDTAFDGAIEWSTVFGGSNEDVARKVIATNDGGLAIFGFTSSIDGDIVGKTLQERDYLLIKTDALGNVEWTKTYGGSGDDRGRDIIQTEDGGFAIVGYSMSADGDGSNNEGFHDNWILKLTSTGAIEWERSFGFSGHDHAYGLVQMDDGGYAMGGFLDVTASGGEGATPLINGNTPDIQHNGGLHGVGEYWVHRLAADGSLMWRKFFGGTNNDRIHSILKANDGGLVLIGFTESDDFDITSTNGEYEFWVIKVDGAGNMLWQKTFGGSAIDISYAAANGPNNTYVIAGSTQSTDKDVSSNAGVTDAWVIKIDDSGTLLWEASFGGSQFDVAHGITPAEGGGYWIAGNSRSADGHLTTNQGENDFLVYKLSENGSLEHQLTLGGSGLDFAYDILETTPNNLVVVGSSESDDKDLATNKGGADIWMVGIH